VITSTLLQARLGLIALCLAGMATPCGSALADNAPVRSVRNLKLKWVPTGDSSLIRAASRSFTLPTPAGCSSSVPIERSWTSTLKDRAAKGFTVIQAYVVRGIAKKHPDGNSSLLEATPFLDRDPAHPNEEFFKHVDYVVNRANDLGLVLGLVDRQVLARH